MGSAFKDGVDAGLSDFKSYNSDLANISLGTEPGWLLQCREHRRTRPRFYLPDEVGLRAHWLKPARRSQILG